uniref:Solute carrier family 13 member 2 n=1 Tax=Rousettus aegyptiacus TaxID=9407 RepID=A0A7J8GH50_ROUAE|nr:hypothetical protein HJG63_017673 [Rousettus aegyptiacus]
MATCWQVLWAYRSYLIVFALPILLLPLPILVATKEAYCAYTIILMAFFWCTEALPLAVTALLPIILFPMMGIMKSSEVCIQYFNDTNVLFFGGLLVAIAVEHRNLHKRIALRVLLIIGVRPALLMLGFMLVTAFLSMWISNTASTAMMMPIAHAVLQQLSKSSRDRDIEEGRNNPTFGLQEISDKNKVTKHENRQIHPLPPGSLESKTNRIQKKYKFSQGMSLCVCYSASIGGLATLTGTGPNLVLQGQVNSLFPNNVNVVNFASWFGFAFPVTVIFLLLTWIWLQILFLGFNLVSDGTVAIFVGMIMFIMPSKIPGLTQDPERPGKLKGPPTLLNWKTVNEKMPWNIVFLLGGGFALAKGCEVSGLSQWLGNKLTPLQSVSPSTIVLILCIMVAAFTECTSNVATASLFLPILASIAQGICLHPLYVMVPCTLSASLAFMLPVATPPNAISFSFGGLRVSDMTLPPARKTSPTRPGKAG